ncbi:MAG: FkbM family methyltransferase [Candidatus Synoicihabitans palmerolidicus]|nr:FkbM family methyltransferase [Candidatus Synoicihabitans palmerolidicus]
MKVETQRAGDLLRKLEIEVVDFCKIDVEGGELLVLQGLVETLRCRRIKFLQLELNRPISQRAGHVVSAPLQFLKTHGYALTPESQPRFDQSEWSCENFVFEPIAPHP